MSASGELLVESFSKPGDLILRPPDGNKLFGGIGARGISFDDAMAHANDLAGKIEVKLTKSR